jgi:hypothetical protein
MSSGGSSQTETKQAYPYAPAMPYLLQGMQDAAKIYSQGGAQYTPWSQVAGFTPEQLQANQGILDYTGSNNTNQFVRGVQGATERQVGGGTNYSNPLMPTAQQGVSNYLGNNGLASNAGVLNQMAYGDNQNPYIETQVKSALDQLSNAFLSTTLPSLRRAAVGNNTYGSSRNQLAEGTAAGQLSGQQMDAANKMYMDAYQTGEQNRQGALNQIAGQQNQQAQNAYNLINQGAGTNLANTSQGLANYTQALAMPLDLLNQRLQIGTAQNTQAQNELNDATNRWNFNENSGWDSLAKFKNLIDATSQLGGVSSSTQMNPAPNVVGNVMGGLLQAAPAAMGAFGGSGGNAAAGQSGAAGSGTSSWATPASMGFNNASTPAAPALGSSNFGGSIGSNSTWAPSKW